MSASKCEIDRKVVSGEFSANLKNISSYPTEIGEVVQSSWMDAAGNRWQLKKSSLGGIEKNIKIISRYFSNVIVKWKQHLLLVLSIKSQVKMNIKVLLTINLTVRMLGVGITICYAQYLWIVQRAIASMIPLSSESMLEFTKILLVIHSLKISPSSNPISFFVT